MADLLRKRNLKRLKIEMAVFCFALAMKFRLIGA